MFVNRFLQIAKWLGRGFQRLGVALRLIGIIIYGSARLSFVFAKFTLKHIVGVIKALAALAIFSAAILFKMKDYGKAKKDAQEKDEVLTKRRFVFGWLLRKISEPRAAEDEEQGSRESLGSVLSSVHELESIDSRRSRPDRRQTGESGGAVVNEEEPSSPKPTNGVTREE